MTTYIQRGRVKSSKKASSSAHQSHSAAADYKAPDGMINFSALVALGKKVATLITNAQKKGLNVTPTLYYVVPAKTAPIKYNEAAAKRKDHKYLAARALKLTERKRLNPATMSNITILLPIVEGTDVPKDIKAELRFAQTAIKSHQAKVLQTKDLVKDIRQDIRDEKAAAFDRAVETVKEMFGEQGIKEPSMVESVGMMGARSLYVKLDKDTVVAITISDVARFNKAKKDSVS